MAVTNCLGFTAMDDIRMITKRARQRQHRRFISEVLSAKLLGSAPKMQEGASPLLFSDCVLEW